MRRCSRTFRYEAVSDLEEDGRRRELGQETKEGKEHGELARNGRELPATCEAEISIELSQGRLQRIARVSAPTRSEHRRGSTAGKGLTIPLRTVRRS